MPTVRVDFFLDSRARLTEQERSLMTAMLSDLVDMVADEFATLLNGSEPANDQGEPLFDRLWTARLLDIPGLVRLLLYRAEEERIEAGIRAGRPAARMRYLQSLVSDEEPEISAAAMALILARGRRRDRFDAPRISFDDLPAEAAVALVNATAAALRGDLEWRLGASVADERLSAATQALLSRHDEGNRLEARLFDLVHALERAGRLDERLIRSALEEAEIPLLTEALARLGRLDYHGARDQLTGGGGRLALLLRLAGLSRDLAGEIIAAAADVVGTDPATEIQAFDSLGDEEVESARKWLRLDPHYRHSIAALGGADG